MKNFSTRAFFALSALCLVPWLNPVQAHADTVTLTLENVGPENNSGGVYTYPYNFSVDGSKTTQSLMCYIYYNEIYVGESWTATVVNVLDAAPTGSALEFQYKELAALYDIASETNDTTTAGKATVSAAQWAAWELFDPTAFPGYTGAPNQGLVDVELFLAAIAAEHEPSSFYSNIDIYYMPTNQSEGTTPPQWFIADPPAGVTPEPGSLVLLGSGLMIFAVVLYRRRNTALAIRL
jgi:hypothetical protein